MVPCPDANLNEMLFFSGGGSPPERAHVCVFLLVCVCVWMNHFARFGLPARFVSMRNH